MKNKETLLTKEEQVLQKELKLFLELRKRYPDLDLIWLITEIWERLRIEETEALTWKKCWLIDIFLHNMHITIEEFKNRLNNII